MKSEKLEKRVKLLTIATTISSGTLLLVILYLTLSSMPKWSDQNPYVKNDSLKLHFLSAERLDITEPNGKLGISLSNSKHTPLPSWDGKELHGASNRNSPNIIFFDGQGDEVGGINFSNNNENGDIIRHLAFDGYKQDEVITLSHFIRNGKSTKGVYIYDRPDIEILDALKEMNIKSKDDETQLQEKLLKFKNDKPERFSEIWYDTKRVALQTNDDEQAELMLADGKGKARLRLLVSERGNAFIEFLDQKGNVIKQIGANN